MKNGRIKEGTDIRWYLNARLHREDGPAIERADGSKEWYLNDQLHREDGPAVETADGSKLWYLNDQLHREDGPAVERADGSKAWYLNGIEYTEQEFNQWLEKKALNEKLQTTLAPKPIIKRSKL
jgi:hypothetical protein